MCRVWRVLEIFGGDFLDWKGDLPENLKNLMLSLTNIESEENTHKIILALLGPNVNLFILHFELENLNHLIISVQKRSGERLRGRPGGPFPWRRRGRRLLRAAASLGPRSVPLRVLRATCHGGSAIGQGSSELHHQCGP